MTVQVPWLLVLLLLLVVVVLLLLLQLLLPLLVLLADFAAGPGRSTVDSTACKVGHCKDMPSLPPLRLLPAGSTGCTANGFS